MRILVADDHALFRRGLKLMLSQLFPDAELVGAGDAGQAWDILEASEPFDIIFLDLAMPGMNGVAGVRRFAARRPATPVIMLSAHVDCDEILECIDLGVRGYIPKSVTETVLRHAIALVLAGEIFMPSEVVARIRSGPGEHTPGLEHLPDTNPLKQLTNRQRDTLALMVEGQSNKEIARSLGLLESTVKAHVKVILKKLGASNRTQAALIAADLGWPRPLRTRAP